MPDGCGWPLRYRRCKQRPQLFGDKVDEKFGVKLLQFEVEGLCAVLAEPVAQQVALRLAEFNVIS